MTIPQCKIKPGNQQNQNNKTNKLKEHPGLFKYRTNLPIFFTGLVYIYICVCVLTSLAVVVAVAVAVAVAVPVAVAVAVAVAAVVVVVVVGQILFCFGQIHHVFW